MKKIAFYVHSKMQLNNKIFYPDKNDYVNADNRMLFFLELKKKFEEYGYNFSTQDINSLKDSKLAIYQQIPNNIKDIKEDSYLLLLESETVTKKNWNKKNHKFFKKIFTYKDILEKKYIQIFNSYSFSSPIINDPKENKKIVMICSNKKSTGKKQLYSYRLKIIRNMNRYLRNNFDLYGVGWNDYSVYVDDKKNINIVRFYDFIIKKLKKLLNIKYLPYIVYRGTVPDKNKILKDYDFSICIENTSEKNFITSIIFESMINSCIPIYKGATNIEKYVPKNCYIDLNNFDNVNQLYKYINSLN